LASNKECASTHRTYGWESESSVADRLIFVNIPPAVLNMASWYNGGGSIEEEEREWESN